jgi:hypothetical protein
LKKFLGKYGWIAACATMTVVRFVILSEADASKATATEVMVLRDSY